MLENRPNLDILQWCSAQKALYRRDDTEEMILPSWVPDRSAKPPFIVNRGWRTSLNRKPSLWISPSDGILGAEGLDLDDIASSTTYELDRIHMLHQSQHILLG
jgi:hypothetical protein